MVEISAGGLGETGDEFLDRRRRAVAALEIEVHAALEGVVADQHLEHADHLRALLIDGRRVEVVDFLVGARPDRMGEGPRILRELGRAQGADIGDALHRARALVGRKFLVAEDGQALLQAELEPVAAGDAVAGPVVEILMRDDRLDRGIVAVGRGLRIGEHVFVVEDVEALVLHRPHVQVGHGDDVEHVEIVVAAEDLLVPAHAAHQRIQRPAGAVGLARLDIDGELDLVAVGGDVILPDMVERAADQREEIGGLRVRIVPDGEMPVAAGEFGRRDEIAVGEQDRRLGLRRFQPDGVDAHHVRAVEEIGDAAEAIRLALRAIDLRGAIEPHQLGIGGGVELGLDRQGEIVRRWIRDRQRLRRHRVGGGVERHTVDRQRFQHEFVAVEL